MSSIAETPLLSLDAYLAGEGEKDLLRFSTAGSVDDGKSTLIGRLLHDTNGAYEDQIAAVKASKVNRSTGSFDFSLLTDGLKAEREQGITIDVAYRYFATARRKFIIADTPGHVQYTRNMATGASTADLAIILVDARNGVLPQTRRHAYISWLLGIEHLVVTINKMDLVDYSKARFDEIREEFEKLCVEFPGAKIHYIPVSALEGDNVVDASPNTPWYGGPTLLELLETVDIAREATERPFRLPVQYVIRPHLNFRGFAGQIASGTVRPGDTVMSLPSGQQAVISRIVAFEGDLAEAFAPMSVNLVLDREIDVSRGDMLVAPQAVPTISRHLETMLVWMSPDDLQLDRTYLLRHGSREVSARVTGIAHRMDIDTFHRQPASGLAMNEIAWVSIETASPLFVDPYLTNRQTGALTLVDPIGNNTVAAGMIQQARVDDAAERRRRELRKQAFRTEAVSPLERQHRFGHRPALLLVETEGDAEILERAFFDHGWQSVWVHGAELNVSVSPAWLNGVLRAGNLVLLTGAGLASVSDWAPLPDQTPVLSVFTLTRNGATAESGVKRVITQLAALGVVPDDSQAGDGEGI